MPCKVVLIVGAHGHPSADSHMAASVLAFREVIGPVRRACCAPPLTPPNACASQAVLAFSTGTAVGAASTFIIVRNIYYRAQWQCETTDNKIVELQRLQGASVDAPRRQPMVVPSLLDIRLRRDLSAAWNQGVLIIHDAARKWL